MTTMKTETPVRLEFAVAGFWSLPPKRMRVEHDEVVGRMYFIDGKTDRILAVARPKENGPANRAALLPS